MARSSVFFSSRTLPGQEYCFIASNASSANRTVLPFFSVNSLRKKLESSGISSLRSRSGGKAMVKTLSRWNKSSRNWPVRTISLKSRFVAAIKRTSTWIVSLEPTRRISRSCITRSSFTWKLNEVSEISSRKAVPPAALSNNPFRDPVAPVKEPRSCPYSSLSRSVSGSAPQLITTKGAFIRALFSWSARAMSSFPDPLSPITSTGASIRAVFATFLYMSTILGVAPMISVFGRFSASSGPTVFDRDSWNFSSMRWRIRSISSTTKGLLM